MYLNTIVSDEGVDIREKGVEETKRKKENVCVLKWKG